MEDGEAILLLGFAFQYAFSAIIIGLLAARKNRDWESWAFFGGFSLLFGALILMFMPFLCPKCRKSISNNDWENRTCPECGDISKKVAEGNNTEQKNETLNTDNPVFAQEPTKDNSIDDKPLPPPRSWFSREWVFRTYVALQVIGVMWAGFSIVVYLNSYQSRLWSPAEPFPLLSLTACVLLPISITKTIDWILVGKDKDAAKK